MVIKLWPNDHKLSCIVLTGDFSSGKTSFALNVAPVLKGSDQQITTLYCDMENSAEEFEKNYEFDRLDMPQLTADEYGPNWNNGQLYDLWWKLVDEATQQYHYNVLVIDDFSPLQDGRITTIKGRDTQDQWAKLKAEFEQRLKLLMTRVDSLIIIVHLRNKRDSSREKEPKGIDTLQKLASLMLYLDRNPNKVLKINGKEYKSAPRYPYPAGYVLKSRLEVVTDRLDEFGDPVRKPLFPDRIPVCTPGALRKYMLNPSVEFNEEEGLPESGVPGMNEPLTESEKVSQQQALNDQELKLRTNEARTLLMRTLVDAGYFATEAEIMKAVRALGISYTLEEHENITAQLISYAENQ